MQFHEFNEDIQHRAMVCGGESSTKIIRHRKKTDKVVAAAALVLRDKGPTWAMENPERFQSEVMKYLGLAARVGLFLAGLFLGGSSIWLTLAKIVLPLVLNMVTEKVTRAGFGAVNNDFEGMADEAHRILMGKKS